LIAYRIADARHAIFDPTGAMLHGGRWNSIGYRVIYAAETYAGALLEVLVHSNLSHPPKNHRVVQIDIPNEISIETVRVEQIINWDSEDMLASQAFGDAWITSNRTAVLRVPSVITKGHENNLVLNTQHPQFTLIKAAPPEDVYWDGRLFSR
jgi:RES domain-containing protein